MGDGGGQKRLQADEQRRKPCGQAMADRDEHAAEIKPVHHEPGRHAVAEACGIRPFGPRQRDHDAEDNEHPEHAEREIGQRLGISQAEFGADKAGRP